VTAGKPRSFKTVAELQDGIDNYYSECKASRVTGVFKGLEVELTEPLTVSGLASSLGVSRDTVHTYATGEYDDEDNKYSDTIKKAVSFIERDKVTKAMLGVYDKTICIFDLKNNHGWKDQQHIENSGSQGRTHTLDSESIAKVLDQLKAFSDGD